MSDALTLQMFDCMRTLTGGRLRLHCNGYTAPRLGLWQDFEAPVDWPTLVEPDSGNLLKTLWQVTGKPEGFQGIPETCSQ